jgi:hypothetical protein
MHAAGYGLFPPDGRAEERDELPLHNTSYRADVLRTFGPRLGDLLADERRLQLAIRKAGHALHFYPASRKRHINEATLRLLIGLAFDGGRRYGGTRARDWSAWRRIGYALASPALVVPIAGGIARKAHGGGFRGSTRLISWLWASCHAAGEAVAYLTGEIDDFTFTETDEFMIRERLGTHGVADPEIAEWIRLLDS